MTFPARSERYHVQSLQADPGYSMSLSSEVFSGVISPAQLAEQLDNPQWRIIDCRFDLAQPEAGEAAYHDGHIPGALYAHLERDLSGPITAHSGRHPLPDPDRLAVTFASWGIGADTQVVCYDAQASVYAARLWWLLRWLGHQAVAVLDGGWEAWEEQQRPIDKQTPRIAPAEFRGQPRPAMFTDSEELLGLLGKPDYRLIDARSPERFSGEKEPIDDRAGHIPGAINLPYQINLDSGDCYLPPEALKKMYRRVLDDTEPEHCILMCGSGVTACHSLLAMEMAGLHGARLYVGSWSEWIRDPQRPIATGNGK